MENIENVLQRTTGVFENKTFVTVLSIVLAFYAGAVAPALPNNVIQFFDTIPGKILFMFMIGYVASQSIQIALMLSVAFVVTLTIANKNKIEESFGNTIDTDEPFMNTETSDPPMDMETSDPSMDTFVDGPIPANNLSGNPADNFAPY